MDFIKLVLFIVAAISVFVLLVFVASEAYEKKFQEDIQLCMEATNRTEIQCRYELRLAERNKPESYTTAMPVYVGK